MTTISNQDVTSLFDRPELADQARAELARLRAEVQQGVRAIDELDYKLSSLACTTHVVSGVALRVEDTTAEGGSCIWIHRVLFDVRRHAEVARNVRTGEWMLIHYAAGTDRIVARSTDKDSLVQQGCEWVAGS